MRRDGALQLGPVTPMENIFISWINWRFENVIQQVFSVDLDPIGPKHKEFYLFWETFRKIIAVGEWYGPVISR